MRRHLPLLLLLAASCGPKVDWEKRLDSSALLQRVRLLEAAGPCAAKVPIEFHDTLPVPLKGGGFEVLHHPVVPQNYAKEHFVVTPTHASVFDDKKSRCLELKPAKLVELGKARPAETQDLAQAYEGMELAAGLYAQGKADEKEAAGLKVFVDAFERAAEPALLPAYYKVNPDFWEFVRKTAGRSIPKA